MKETKLMDGLGLSCLFISCELHIARNGVIFFPFLVVVVVVVANFNPGLFSILLQAYHITHGKFSLEVCMVFENHILNRDPAELDNLTPR